MESWELIVVGGGPAGLAAGIYGARSGLKPLILEEKIVGGTAADAPLVENYPGFQSIAGSDLVQKMAVQCKNAGVSIHEFESVAELDLKGEKKIVRTSKATYEAQAVVIATGSHYREINVPGEKEFRGRGVSYCGICDGPLFRGKRVLVVGGGNAALMTALYLAEHAAEVKIAHRRDAFRAEDALVRSLQAKKNIEVLWSAEVTQIQGEKLVSNVLLLSSETGEAQKLSVDGVFIQVGEDPNSQLAKDAGVDVDNDGYVRVDIMQRTSVAGVYAAGDVTNHPVKQIGTAVGQGITAALEAYGFVRRPYYKTR